jgi:dTDP-4-amino-4,6-dideoxygalactose transaminase
VTRFGALIPRARSNVRLADLARAARVSEDSNERRARLIARLEALTEHSHVALAASGRGALLALLATSGRPRAVIPGYTCKAVVEAAHLAGVEVDLVDVTDGYNWSADDVAAAAGPDASVVVTHQFGIAGDVERVVAAARSAGALVIEDCAAALGGRFRGRRLGSFGEAAAYSFDMSKLVQVPPKGGALTTADGDWAERAAAWIERETQPMSRGRTAAAQAQAAVLAAADRPRPYRLLHTAVLAGRKRATIDSPDLQILRGPFYNTRFAEWQADVVLPQVERVDALAAAARTLYQTYLDGLAGCRAVTLPPVDTGGEWAPIRFPILVPGDKLAFYEQLLERGVDCALSFTYLARRDGLPRAAALADGVLDLPFYSRLTPAEAEHVITAVTEIDARWAE